MPYELARQIASLSADEAWSLIRDQSEKFIWDEHGDEVEDFNRLAAATPGVDQVALVYHDEIPEMGYKGRAVRVPLEFDREDNLRAIYTLSQLTRDDYELRFCLDSQGSSDVAFLGLPPAQWRDLEREYGGEPVALRFLRIDPDYATFCEEAFEKYGAAGARVYTEKELLLKAFSDAVLVEANKYTSCEIASSDDENYVEILLVTGTDAQRDELLDNPVFCAALEKLVEEQLHPGGLIMESVTIESHETAELYWGGLFLPDALREYSTRLKFNERPGVAVIAQKTHGRVRRLLLSLWGKLGG